MAIDIRVCVYINGIRFYPTAVSYTASVGGDERFSVGVPSHPAWDLLPVRSHAAVFYTDPIDKTWRFLAEGEYVSVSKSKSASASRTRTLEFNSLFSYLQRNTYTNAFAAISDIDSQLLAIANGKILAGTETTDKPLSTLLTEAKSDNIVSYIPEFLTLLTHQCPVESFYFKQRLLEQRMFWLKDTEIEKSLSFAFWFKLLNGPITAMGTQPTQPLEELVRLAETMAFYLRCPLPNSFGKTLLFMPELFNTLPPPCNIIFSDQLSQFNITQQLVHIPTRIIAQYSGPTGKEKIPLLYIYNGTDFSTTAELSSKGEAAAKGLFSEQELQQGIVSTGVESIQYSKLVSTFSDAAATPEITDFINTMSRFQLLNVQSEYLQESISSVFLPYVVPGFHCAIEESTSPIIGYVESVSHYFSATSAPHTSVSITKARNLAVNTDNISKYQYPSWLNKKFNLKDCQNTFSELLGCLTTIPVTQSVDTTISTVFPVPTVSNNVVYGPSENTEADILRQAPDVPIAMYGYQYRQGLNVKEYWEQRAIGYSGGTTAAIDPAEEVLYGNTFFGHPPGLTKATSNGYFATGLINTTRITITRNIAKSLAPGITSVL